MIRHMKSTPDMHHILTFKLDALKASLLKHHQLQDRSAKDVLSRMRRVSRMIKIDADLPTETLIKFLEKDHNFSQFNTSVRSQLKRATRLYLKFKSIQ